MKYTPPLGAEENAPYINGNELTGTEGSIVPAEALEHPQREIINVINDAGFDPNAGDLGQLSASIKKLINDNNAVNSINLCPEVLTNNGRILVEITPGVLTVQGSEQLIWSRKSSQINVGSYSLADRTFNFNSGANDIYHLRWSFENGFSLKDLNDSTYNPSSLDDRDNAFFSTFDNALIGAVIAGQYFPCYITRQKRYEFKNLEGSGTLLIPIGYSDRSFKFTLNIFHPGHPAGGFRWVDASGQHLFFRRSTSGATGVFGAGFSTTGDLLTTSNLQTENSFVSVIGSMLDEGLMQAQVRQSEDGGAAGTDPQEELFSFVRKVLTIEERKNGLPIEYVNVGNFASYRSLLIAEVS